MSKSTLNINPELLVAEVNEYRNDALTFDAERVQAVNRAEIIDNVTLTLLQKHGVTIEELKALIAKCDTKISDLETKLADAKRVQRSAKIMEDAKKKMYNIAKDHFEDTKILLGVANSDGSAGGKKDRAEADWDEAKGDLSKANVTVEIHGYNLMMAERVKTEAQAELTKTENQVRLIFQALGHIRAYKDQGTRHTGLFFRSLALSDKMDQFRIDVSEGDRNAVSKLNSNLPDKNYWETKEGKDLVAFMHDPATAELRAAGQQRTFEAQAALAGHLIVATQEDIERIGSLQGVDRTVVVKGDRWMAPELIKLNHDSAMANIEAEKWEGYLKIAKWTGAAAVAAPIAAAAIVTVLPVASGFAGVTGGSFTMTGLGLTAPAAATSTGIVGVTQLPSGLLVAESGVVGGGTAVTSGTATSASGLIIPSASTVGAGTSTALTTSGTATTAAELILPAGTSTATAGSSTLGRFGANLLGHGRSLLNGIKPAGNMGQGGLTINSISSAGNMGQSGLVFGGASTSAAGASTAVTSSAATSASGLIIPSASSVGAGTSAALTTSGSATSAAGLIIPGASTSAGAAGGGLVLPGVSPISTAVPKLVLIGG